MALVPYPPGPTREEAGAMMYYIPHFSAEIPFRGEGYVGGEKSIHLPHANWFHCLDARGQRVGNPQIAFALEITHGGNVVICPRGDDLLSLGKRILLGTNAYLTITKLDGTAHLGTQSVMALKQGPLGTAFIQDPGAKIECYAKTPNGPVRWHQLEDRLKGRNSKLILDFGQHLLETSPVGHRLIVDLAFGIGYKLAVSHKMFRFINDNDRVTDTRYWYGITFSCGTKYRIGVGVDEAFPFTAYPFPDPPVGNANFQHGEIMIFGEGAQVKAYYTGMDGFEGLSNLGVYSPSNMMAAEGEFFLTFKWTNGIVTDGKRQLRFRSEPPYNLYRFAPGFYMIYMDHLRQDLSVKIIAESLDLVQVEPIQRNTLLFEHPTFYEIFLPAVAG